MNRLALALFLGLAMACDMAEGEPVLTSSTDLAIVSAKYGTDENRIEIASALQPLFRHGYIILRAKWAMKKDPAPGEVKDVRIIYRVFDNESAATFRQDQDLILPPPPANGLVIVNATYGVPNRSVDVTDELRKQISHNAVKLSPDLTLGRVDPAFMVPKKLEVLYLYDGLLKEATFADGEAVILPAEEGSRAEVGFTKGE